MKKSDGLYMGMVKLGPKCQIVIPREVREMFDITSGESLVLFADKNRGIALQKADSVSDLAKKILNKALNEEEK